MTIQEKELCWQMTADNVYTDTKEIQIALDFNTRQVFMSYLLRHSVEQTLMGNLDKAKLIRELIDEIVPESIVAKDN